MNLVLFFTQGVSLHLWDQTGMFDREVALYKELQARGHQITFVTYGNKSELVYGKQLSGIRIFCNQWNWPSAWYRRSLKFLAPVGSLYKSNQIAGADVALATARRAGKPFVARCGYLPSLFIARSHGPGSVELTEARKLENDVFTGADRVVVTTPLIKQTVVEQYDLDPTTVEVIPNYVETNRFKPLRGKKSERIRIGFVGRLDLQKNLANLITAVSGLKVELDLVGSGPLFPELEAQAKFLDTPVRFLGNLPNRQIPEFLNTCDLFLLPSLYEGHPKALLEAMACGLPVIGTRVEGIDEVITDGQNGLLCEPDASSIRAAIQRLLSDDDLCERIGENAYRFVRDNFSLDHILNLELAVLEKVNLR